MGVYHVSLTVWILSYGVFGLQSTSPLFASPSGLDPTNLFEIPGIRNPLTGRNIQPGGPIYRKLIKQGGWVQHQGTLVKLDLEALRDRKDEHLPQAQSFDAYPDNSDEIVTEDWYRIKPEVVEQHKSNKHLDNDTANQLNSQLLFVNKPAALHCVPPRDLSDSLSSLVSQLYSSAKPCHRLDRDTSGIVVFGLTRDSHIDISRQFEDRTTIKTYTALIDGHPADESGIIELPIGKQKTPEGFNRWTIGGERPRSAITEWRLDETFDIDGAKFSRVVLTPKTGRGHQLRLHLKALGHPILGDTIHGDAGIATCSPRLCLHAQKLQVDWHGLRLEATTVAPF